jgi:hypothetical protein
MARRHMFWVILSGTTATAFRATTRDELLPTLRQLQRTQKDATVRWFENGKLWESPEAARAAVVAGRTARKPSLGPGWRPGGNHVDPRAKYDIPRDEKRARFKRRMISGKTTPRKPGGSGGDDS